jgi:hypothetical protein
MILLYISISPFTKDTTYCVFDTTKSRGTYELSTLSGALLAFDEARFRLHSPAAAYYNRVFTNTNNNNHSYDITGIDLRNLDIAEATIYNKYPEILL